MAGITCYFYIPWALSILARALSVSRFDSWWICSQAMVLHAWMVSLGAVSIENAMSHKEARDRLGELEALHDISWTLVGASGVKELVSILANTLRERLEASIATVYLADASREALEVVAVAGPDICLSSLGKRYAVTSANRFPGFHTGHTARAFVTGKVQVARDVSVDVELVPWRIAAVDDGSAVSLPLVDKGEAWGVLNLYFADHRHLTPQRMKLMMTIAAAASPAIRSAQSAASGEDAGPDELDLAA
jgi:GAF domain-containing protein